jgi:F-type H+-transporting ATPase subunit c
MGKNPKMISFLLTVSILGVALVESAAIYALIVSFQILDKETLGGIAAIGAGLAIGLAGLGAGIGEGLLIKGAIKGINQNPELKGKVMAFMVLFVALVEVVAIYGMIIAFKVIDEGSKVVEETLKVIG